MIDSPQNAKVKSWLREVEERQLFVLEGEKFVADAAAAGFRFEAILHDPGLKAGRLAVLSKERPVAVSRAVLERFCEARSPQHVAALARRREFSPAEVLHPPGSAVYLYGMQDPNNVGALARVLEAVGGAGLLTSPGTADAFHPRALRASAGSLLRIPVAAGIELPEFIRHARESRREVIGAAGAGGQSVFAAAFAPRIAWVFGSEGAGLPADALAAVDRVVSVPMHPPVESLNVAVAAGVLLYVSSTPSTDRAPAAPPRAQ